MTATHDKEWKIVNKARDGSKFYSKDGKRCWDIPFDLEDQIRREAKKELLDEIQEESEFTHDINISARKWLELRAKTLGEQKNAN